MLDSYNHLSRRGFLSSTLAVGAGLALGKSTFGYQPRMELAESDKALVVICLDLEMSRHFPKRGMTEWDFQKGNLNEKTKQYTVEASRRVKAKGGVLHSFVVGRVLEQANVDWLKQIIDDGHPLGNHTYDHVRVTAQKIEDVQYRFGRSPWLLAGRTPAQAIAENIRLCETAMQERLDFRPIGFTAPYGFKEGLNGREDVQEIFLSLGFKWVSTKYKGIPNLPRTNPGPDVFERAAEIQAEHQPYFYPTGLLEIPNSPMSDVSAFRSLDWTVDEFCQAQEAGIKWAIDHGGIYNWTGHPSIQYVKDPEFRAIEHMCDVVNESGGKAAIVGRDVVAQRVFLQQEKN